MVPQGQKGRRRPDSGSIRASGDEICRLLEADGSKRHRFGCHPADFWSQTSFLLFLILEKIVFPWGGMAPINIRLYLYRGGVYKANRIGMFTIIHKSLQLRHLQKPKITPYLSRKTSLCTNFRMYTLRRKSLIMS